MSPRTGLHVMNADGSGKRPLAAVRTCDCSISWSPDGKTILFAASQGKAPGLHALDVESGRTTLVRPNTVHLKTILAAMTLLPAWPGAARYFVGYLLIFRLTALGLTRPRLDTTCCSRISSRIA